MQPPSDLAKVLGMVGASIAIFAAIAATGQTISEKADETDVVSLRVENARQDERIDNLKTQLDRIEKKLDQVLEKR